jgi:hypothetical protein
MFSIRFMHVTTALVKSGSLSLLKTVGNIAKFISARSRSARATVRANLSGIGTINGNFEKQQIAVRMYFE